jgi:alcohol dehydrogenase
MSIERFAFPTAIYFGAGARKLVAEHLAAQGLERPLIVTDRGIAPLPLLAKFIADLHRLDVAVYSDIWGNPVKSQVADGVTAFRKHRADSIIGLGGGAALDVAKAIALMAVHQGDVLHYAWDHPQVRPIEHELPYFVALPTTAGTGSEVGRSSVISDDATHIKKIIFSPRLLAKAVFADPELTLDLPPAITAATGMDALTHAIEAYVSTAANPITDACALKAMTLISNNLRLAVRDGSDLAARENMAYAQFLAGMAFNNASLGYVHAMAHQLGGFYDLPHGVCNAVLLPHVQTFNALVCAERLTDVAHAMGADIRGFSPEEGAQAAINAIRCLARDVDIPGGLRELGAKLSDIPVLATNALKDACGLTNPRAADQRQIEEIFRNAF